MTNTYQRFLDTGIDLTPLGVRKGTGEKTYFCTPRGASIFGWEGIGGIHFCFLHGFDEMVFAVSPENLAPNCVHPLAKNFEDFLRLLLACGNAAVLEQGWRWNRAQFDTYLEECPPTKEQKTVLEEMAKKLNLTPMEKPWEYYKDLQSGFDYSKIEYTEDFYELHGKDQ